MRTGRCPACLGKYSLQCHHIYPKRWFGDYPPYKYLCADCHAQLERLITAEETRFTKRPVKLKRGQYSEILNYYIVWKNSQVSDRQEYLSHRAGKVAIHGNRAVQVTNRGYRAKRRRAA